MRSERLRDQDQSFREKLAKLTYYQRIACAFIADSKSLSKNYLLNLGVSTETIQELLDSKVIQEVSITGRAETRWGEEHLPVYELVSRDFSNFIARSAAEVNAYTKE